MQSATRLLTDLRSTSSTTILPYAEDTVRAVLNDIVGLSQGIEARLSGAEGGDASTHALTVVQNFTLRRHKRCLIVYHSARCARVEALRWNTGAVLPPAARDNLCSSEVDYFKAYSEAVSRYLDKAGLDLTAVRALARRGAGAGWGGAAARGAPTLAPPNRRRGLPPRPLPWARARAQPLTHCPLPPTLPSLPTHARRAEPQAAKAGPHPGAGHPGLRGGANRVRPAHREPRRNALYEPRGGGAAGAPGADGAAKRIDSVCLNMKKGTTKLLQTLR